MLQVPQIWAKVAYPCLKPLGSWFKDYLRRVAFMRTWLTEGQPACFWLPGFFFPQGFLTGVLQVHARKYTIPIDTLAFQFSVTDHSDAAEVCQPHNKRETALWMEPSSGHRVVHHPAKCLERTSVGAGAGSP